MKDELGRKIMTEFPPSKPKAYSYLIHDNDKSKKKSRDTKKYFIKQKLKLEVSKNCFESNHLKNEIKPQDKKINLM